MRIMAPSSATTKLYISKPVIPGRSNAFIIHPPTTPPTIPRAMFIIIPCSASVLMIMEAIHPINPPKTIHKIMLIQLFD